MNKRNPRLFPKQIYISSEINCEPCRSSLLCVIVDKQPTRLPSTVQVTRVKVKPKAEKKNYHFLIKHCTYFFYMYGCTVALEKLKVHVALLTGTLTGDRTCLYRFVQSLFRTLGYKTLSVQLRNTRLSKSLLKQESADGNGSCNVTQQQQEYGACLG